MEQKLSLIKLEPCKEDTQSQVGTLFMNTATVLCVCAYCELYTYKLIRYYTWVPCLEIMIFYSLKDSLGMRTTALRTKGWSSLVQSEMLLVLEYLFWVSLYLCNFVSVFWVSLHLCNCISDWEVWQIYVSAYYENAAFFQSYFLMSVLVSSH